MRMSVVHTSYFASPELKIDENTPFENKTITLNASVEFYVIGKLVDSSWIGIGFNKEKNKKMKGTDIIMGYFDEKDVSVIKDFHATATIGTPKVDKSQDLISSKLTKKDGFVMLQFKRNIVSSDKVSISVAVQRVLALCYFWNLEKVALAKNRISKISILCTQ